MEELKIGETKEIDGIKVECKEDGYEYECASCAFYGMKYASLCEKMKCLSQSRTDKTDVHFVRV